jgi:putative PIN family toxin of toxin-antitoxin system
MRVVIDTNVLLVSIPSRSFYRPIFNALLTGKFEMAFSNEILVEYTEILEQKANTIVATNIGELLLNLPNAIKTEVYYHWELIQHDQDDNKFVDCAIAANAKFLVSNDRHFNVLKLIDFPKLEVIGINEFMSYV